MVRVSTVSGHQRRLPHRRPVKRPHGKYSYLLAEQVQETLPEMRLSEPPLPQSMMLTTPDPSALTVSMVLPPSRDVNESIWGADAGGMVMAAFPMSAGNDWLA